MEQLLNLILGPLRQSAPPPGGCDGKDAVGGELTAWLEAVAPDDADPAADPDATAAAETASADEETADHWISVGSVLEREVWAWTGITGSIAPSVDASDTVDASDAAGLAPGRGASALAMPLGALAADGQAPGATGSEDATASELETHARMAAAGAVEDGEGGIKGNAATTSADDSARAGIEAAAGSSVARTSEDAADGAVSRGAQAEGQSLQAFSPGAPFHPVAAQASSRRAIAETLARDGVASATRDGQSADSGTAETAQQPDPSGPGVTPDTLPATGARALSDAIAKPGAPAFDIASPGLALSQEAAAAESLRGAELTPQGHTARPGEAAAQAVARQIGGATLWHRQGEIEIALSPEELGRVRLVVTGGERGATVTVFFDRPDVLDLMRRHPEQLMQDLRDSGFADARLDLRDGSTGQRQRPDSPEPRGETAPPDSAEPPQSLPRTADPARLAARAAAGDRHLDIRL